MQYVCFLSLNPMELVIAGGKLRIILIYGHFRINSIKVFVLGRLLGINLFNLCFPIKKGEI